MCVVVCGSWCWTGGSWIPRWKKIRSPALLPNVSLVAYTDVTVHALEEAEVTAGAFGKVQRLPDSYLCGFIALELRQQQLSKLGKANFF